ncbi:MAG: DUF389 domain-containing protein [Bacteroidales bacterium]|nr:DUF389 domain-containing protein [Bacteroidales bacterium]
MRHLRLLRKFLDYIDLESDLDDFDKIHSIIEKDLVFKGTNLWILVFAIIVASVGLNMNSTAVIIGAMLISPLMGPINGMGYSIATYNFTLFRQALKNFTFAVIASLAASTAYFALSPISTAHSELLARTSPTIYDVLIALFGGLAGIVAISSKQKGNVIPGVAIATALMPPLCTAGYGLATGQIEYFLGALYLFTINTVFIAISSVVVSQMLKFPIRTLVDSDQKKRTNRWISFIIILVLIPSIYFGYNLVQKEKFMGNASRFVNNVRVVEGNFLLNNEIDPKNKKIKLIYGGSSLREKDREMIRQKSKDFLLEGAVLEFQQGFSFDELTRKSNEVENLKFEISQISAILQDKEKFIDSLNSRHVIGRQLLDELKVMTPGIVSCSFSETYSYRDTVTIPQKTGIVILETEGLVLTVEEKNKISDWIKVRLKSDKIRTFFN